jgi:hypothetical protein
MHPAFRRQINTLAGQLFCVWGTLDCISCAIRLNWRAVQDHGADGCKQIAGREGVDQLDHHYKRALLDLS